VAEYSSHCVADYSHNTLALKYFLEA
jgi:hypothetical protein